MPFFEVVPARRSFPLLFAGVISLLWACDPNVVIGAKWHIEGAVGGSSAGQPVTSSGSAGKAAEGGEAGSGTNVAMGGSEAGGAGGDAGGAPSPPEWCVVAPWLNTPALFTSEAGNDIPAGHYRVLYMTGAQLHDPKLGYEVTRHYFGTGMIQAGHHIYSGESPETGVTSLWLSDDGLVNGTSVADVEAANKGHSWTLDHQGGELRITLYDDDYHDNIGPGTQLCITP